MCIYIAAYVSDCGRCGLSEDQALPPSFFPVICYLNLFCGWAMLSLGFSILAAIDPWDDP